MDMVSGQSLSQLLEEKVDRGGFDNERLCENYLKNQTKISSLTEQECKHIFTQLLDVIEYLGSEDIGVCHRDINPNNLMLELVDESQSNLQIQQQACSDFNQNSKEVKGRDSE